MGQWISQLLITWNLRVAHIYKYISIAWLIKKLYDFQLNTKNFNSFV